MMNCTEFMLEVRNVCRHLVGHRQGKKQFGTASCVLKDHIKTDNMLNTLN